MVTLSVTRSRIAAVLTDAEALLKTEGWDPLHHPVITAIDHAAGFTPGSSSPDAEETTLAAWQQLADHLDVASVSQWEREPGRTQLQVLAALRDAAAKAVTV
jgi:hypothetical protein